MTVAYKMNGDVYILYDVIDMFTAQNDNDTFVVVVKGGAVRLIPRADIRAVRGVDTNKGEHYAADAS